MNEDDVPFWAIKLVKGVGEELKGSVRIRTEGEISVVIAELLRTLRSRNFPNLEQLTGLISQPYLRNILYDLLEDEGSEEEVEEVRQVEYSMDEYFMSEKMKRVVYGERASVEGTEDTNALEGFARMLVQHEKDIKSDLKFTENLQEIVTGLLHNLIYLPHDSKRLGLYMTFLLSVSSYGGESVFGFLTEKCRLVEPTLILLLHVCSNLTADYYNPQSFSTSRVRFIDRFLVHLLKTLQPTPLTVDSKTAFLALIKRFRTILSTHPLERNDIMHLLKLKIVPSLSVPSLADLSSSISPHNLSQYLLFISDDSTFNRILQLEM